jgi:hypothetical protein
VHLVAEPAHANLELLPGEQAPLDKVTLEEVQLRMQAMPQLEVEVVVVEAVLEHQVQVAAAQAALLQRILLMVFYILVVVVVVGSALLVPEVVGLEVVPLMEMEQTQQLIVVVVEEEEVQMPLDKPVEQEDLG